MEEEKFTFSEETDAINTVNESVETEVKQEETVTITEEPNTVVTPVTPETTNIETKKKDPRNTIILVLFIIIIILAAVALVLYLTKDKRKGGDTPTTTTTEKVSVNYSEIDPTFDAKTRVLYLSDNTVETYVDKKDYDYTLNGEKHVLSLFYRYEVQENNPYEDCGGMAELEEGECREYFYTLTVDGKTFNEDRESWLSTNRLSDYINPEEVKLTILKDNKEKEYLLVSTDDITHAPPVYVMFIINDKNEAIFNYIEQSMFDKDGEHIFGNGNYTILDNSIKYLISDDDDIYKVHEVIVKIVDGNIVIEKGETHKNITGYGAR